MIDHLNNLLRKLFETRVARLGADGIAVDPEQQIAFQPPDERWRTYVSGDLQRFALNVYLVDLRENRKLRSNRRVREPGKDFVKETPAPDRVDCHYLISAWSPTEPGPAVEPALDEQVLLYQVTAALMNSVPLVPREVYDPDSLPGDFPEAIADAELPTQILPVEGFPKLAEFWGQMGEGSHWKPVVYLIVTLPVILTAEIVGPMVTTRITKYRLNGGAGRAETRIKIGGRVTRPNPDPDPEAEPLPVTEAWVRLETPDNDPLQTTETDEEGRFTFSNLDIGRYLLRVRAPGFEEIENHPLGVPAPDGSYDVQVSSRR